MALEPVVEQRYWNGVALFVFIILCTLSVVAISRYATTSPADLGFFDLTALALGTFRLVHLLTYDKIFGLVRALFMDGKEAKLKKATRGWRRLICEFFECIWCTGIWSALFAVTVYLLGTWGRFTIIVLAVAGLGSLFQLVSKTIAARA